MPTPRTRMLLVSIVPPRNDCGVRIVMHRHFVERQPFDLHVASPADFSDDLLIHTPLQLPSILRRLRKSRFGPSIARWVHDYENLIWPLRIDHALQQAIDEFKPHVILTLAETGLCHMAARAAKRNGLPLASLFLDWFPYMEPYCGHPIFQPILSRRYRKLYQQSDLAICTSDGMKEELGSHPNSHVVYPMPGKHTIPDEITPPKQKDVFRIVYVGAAEGFYGDMLRNLLTQLSNRKEIELLVVGPTSDWPKETLNKESCLGFMPPEEAASVLAGADALLVVMGFEKERERFMRTSFTTKFLDYSAFHKPIIMWGPSYCTPVRVAQREDAAIVVDTVDASTVVTEIDRLRENTDFVSRYTAAARRLSKTLFDADRLQEILVTQINKLAHGNR